MQAFLITLLTPLIKEAFSMIVGVVLDIIKEEAKKRETNAQVKDAVKTGNTSALESQLRGL